MNKTLIGQRITQLRSWKGLKQQTMADHLKLTRSAYAKLETGDTELSYPVAVELSKFHGVDLSFFISEAPVVIQQQHNQSATANGYVETLNQNGVEHDSPILSRMLEQTQELFKRLMDYLERMK
ncbi:MAG: helix-turn-helix transcriptional regulator [Flavobacteriales bacterium]|nr:helix-turn-helix transcriptional regulator [Flavobacteriales bacterium]